MKTPELQRYSRYNEAAPDGGGTPTRGLTRSSDYGREGLAMKATRQEQWRPIPGSSGRYEASSLGRIRSTETVRLGGKMLKPTANSKGYLTVCVYLDGRAVTRSVHRLVATAFYGEAPEGHTHVRHLDGDKLNNRVENLRYGTPRENELDKIRHGGNLNFNKTHCPEGHPYDDDNTDVYHCADGRTFRRCRTCRGVQQKTRVFKPLTPEQREHKAALQRQRRAERKAALDGSGEQHE